MKGGFSRVRRVVTFGVALVLVGSLYVLGQPPTLSGTEADAIAARFRFEKLPFPEPAGLVTPAVPTIPPRHDHESTPPGKKEAVKLQDLIRAGLVGPPLTLEKKYAEQDLGTLDSLGLIEGDMVTVADAVRAMIVVSDTPTAVLMKRATINAQSYHTATVRTTLLRRSSHGFHRRSADPSSV